MMATIDYNIASGISRATREVGADGIILGWPSKTGIIEKMVGEKSESILNRTDANLFMCHVDQPLIAHKRITVVCPPLAEAELGFHFWLEKVFSLARELTVTVQFICDERAESAITEYMQRTKQTIRTVYSHYDGWDDLVRTRQFIQDTDLIVFVSARVGDMSHRHSFESLPMKIVRWFGDRNRLLAYPSRRTSNSFDDFEDVPATPILQRIGRGIGSLFNPKTDQQE